MSTNNNDPWWTLYSGAWAGCGDYDPAQMELPIGDQKVFGGLTCECGQYKVDRVEDRIPELHSRWCPVYKEVK